MKKKLLSELLDAATELEHADLPSLAESVRKARAILMRQHDIEARDTIIPPASDTEPELERGKSNGMNGSNGFGAHA